MNNWRTLQICIYFTWLPLLSHRGVNAQSINNYQYDAEGRLTADLSEGIARIEWNNLNKITRIVRADTSHAADLEFAYDALGNRIMKLVKLRNGQGLQPENTWVYTYYVPDLKSNPQAIYTRAYEAQATSGKYTEQYQVVEKHLQGSSRSGFEEPIMQALVRHNFTASLNSNGRFANLQEQHITHITKDTDSLTTRLGNKRYELDNHIGNVLAVVGDRKAALTANQNTINSYRAALLSSTDYYPFGMAMSSRTFNSPDYRYGFSGKEKNDELSGKNNSYDFGARFYNARLGKWLSEDPLQAKYPSISPYTFVLNNPILFVDPDGKEVTEVKGDPVPGYADYSPIELLTSTEQGRKIYNSVNNNPNISVYIARRNGEFFTGNFDDDPASKDIVISSLVFPDEVPSRITEGSRFDVFRNIDPRKDWENHKAIYIIIDRIQEDPFQEALTLGYAFSILNNMTRSYKIPANILTDCGNNLYCAAEFLYGRDYKSTIKYEPFFDAKTQKFSVKWRTNSRVGSPAYTLECQISENISETLQFRANKRKQVEASEKKEK